MPDIYATVSEAPPAVLAQLDDILELRAADPQQQEMREAYLASIDFPPGARAVEVGCGTGAVARAIASRPGIAWSSASIGRGWLAVFDGDYVTTTMSTGAFDPLQACADAARVTARSSSPCARRWAGSRTGTRPSQRRPPRLTRAPRTE